MHALRIVGSLLLAATIAACQAAAAPSRPASTPAPSPVASPAATHRATSTPQPTVALGPRVTLTLDISGPIVRSTDGPAGHSYSLPAAAARDAGGGYVLFIIWFGPVAGDQVVTVARSDDGRTWRTGTTPILTDLGMRLANPQAIPASAIQLDDGTWQLYGWAAHVTDSQAFTSWRASAPRPEGPWTLDKEEVLGRGQAGAWDSQTASVGGVHRTPDGYALWYEGQAPGSTIRGDVGYATSVDGLTWTKLDDPVIRRGICGPGSQQAIFQPEIQPSAIGFTGILGAFAPGRETMDLFGATSVDGRDWRCGSEATVLRAEDIPGSQGIHTIASMRLADGTFGLILESLGDARSDLWLATVAVAP